MGFVCLVDWVRDCSAVCDIFSAFYRNASVEPTLWRVLTSFPLWTARFIGLVILFQSFR